MQIDTIMTEDSFGTRYLLGKTRNFNFGAAPKAKNFFFDRDSATRFAQRLNFSQDALWRLLKLCDIELRYGHSRYEQLAHAYRLPVHCALITHQIATSAARNSNFQLMYFLQHP